MPTATLPAQSVVITDLLDADLDWSTFHLEEVGFNNTTAFSLESDPAPIQKYTAQVTVSTDPYPVEVTAGLNPSSGLVTWQMQSVDPVTGGWPADPLAGFLPPNDATQRGEGWVIFSILPVPGLAHGHSLLNRAGIVFDVNASIQTNQVTNTIDSQAPTCEMEALPMQIYNSTFTLRWSASDGTLGSGVSTVDVYVSVDGGGFALWQAGLSDPSAQFTGQSGHSYRFYCHARDQVGNQPILAPFPQSQTSIASSRRLFLPVLRR
jgi:hypothetical protein